MPINNGFILLSRDNGDVELRIYYDTNATPVGPTQPLINGPRGFCLDVTNKTGAGVRVSLSGAAGVLASNVLVAQGDPVTSGAGRSRTVAVLNTAGFLTRGDVSDISLG